MAFTLRARFESSEILRVVTLKILAYAAPVGKQKAFRHRIVDACQTFRNYPGIFERILLSMI
jgi:hypothetical protein